jgi:uncharacterized membrane protein SirB2
VSPEVYLVLKQVHRACALLSIVGFAARWSASLAQQPWVRGRLARTLPHVVDTALLLSALAMAFGAAIVPTDAPWLAAKIVLLLVYIGLGMVALSARRPRRDRMLAGVAALLVFAHIVAVAWFKHPAGLLQRLT